MTKKLSNSQFVLTTQTIKYLHVFDFSAVTKLVLLELSTHYYERKNGKIVFPTINFIANTLGVGQTSVKTAITELVKQGILTKEKRHKIYGNYNEYEFTDKYFMAVHFIDFKEQRDDTIDYELWREAVYQKYQGVCQLCGTTNGIMHAHHKKEYAKNPEKRYDISNGILLCEKCHAKLHPWMKSS